MSSLKSQIYEKKNQELLLNGQMQSNCIFIFTHNDPNTPSHFSDQQAICRLQSERLLLLLDDLNPVLTTSTQTLRFDQNVSLVSCPSTEHKAHTVTHMAQIGLQSSNFKVKTSSNFSTCFLKKPLACILS